MFAILNSEWFFNETKISLGSHWRRDKFYTPKFGVEILWYSFFKFF